MFDRTGVGRMFCCAEARKKQVSALEGRINFVRKIQRQTRLSLNPRCSFVYKTFLQLWALPTGIKGQIGIIFFKSRQSGEKGYIWFHACHLYWTCFFSHQRDSVQRWEHDAALQLGRVLRPQPGEGGAGRRRGGPAASHQCSGEEHHSAARKHLPQSEWSAGASVREVHDPGTGRLVCFENVFDLSDRSYLRNELWLDCVCVFSFYSVRLLLRKGKQKQNTPTAKMVRWSALFVLFLLSNTIVWIRMKLVLLQIWWWAPRLRMVRWMWSVPELTAVAPWITVRHQQGVTVPQLEGRLFRYQLDLWSCRRNQCLLTTHAKSELIDAFKTQVSLLLLWWSLNEFAKYLVNIHIFLKHFFLVEFLKLPCFSFTHCYAFLLYYEIRVIQSLSSASTPSTSPSVASNI